MSRTSKHLVALDARIQQLAHTVAEKERNVETAQRDLTHTVALITELETLRESFVQAGQRVAKRRREPAA